MLITHAIFLSGSTANGGWVCMFERRKDYTICKDTVERRLSLNDGSAVFPIARD